MNEVYCPSHLTKDKRLWKTTFYLKPFFYGNSLSELEDNKNHKRWDICIGYCVKGFMFQHRVGQYYCFIQPRGENPILNNLGIASNKNEHSHRQRHNKRS